MRIGGICAILAGLLYFAGAIIMTVMKLSVPVKTAAEMFAHTAANPAPYMAWSGFMEDERGAGFSWGWSDWHNVTRAKLCASGFPG